MQTQRGIGQSLEETSSLKQVMGGRERGHLSMGTLILLTSCMS